ncbi:MAG: type I methionyl aminopeptidase [Bacteroidota bacterium]
MAKGTVFYKTDEEIELMRESNLLVAKTLGLVASMIGTGVSGKKIDTAAEEFIRDHNAVPGFKGYGGFPATLCISINDQVVHGIPSDEPFKNGDVVSVDCGVKMNGFFGDCAFTFAIGDVDQATIELLEVTQESLYIGIEKAIVGARLGDISNAIQMFAEREHGYGVVRELVGHGIGRNLHEPPEVPNYGRRGQGPKLKEGLVIAIEPMVNLGTRHVRQKKDGWTIVTRDNKPSAHFEHSVAIRKNGPDILSTHEYVEASIKNNPELKEISRKSQIFAVRK